MIFIPVLAVLLGIFLSAVLMGDFWKTLRKRVLEGKESTGIGLLLGPVQIVIYWAILGWALGLFPWAPRLQGYTGTLALLSSFLITLAVAGLILKLYLHTLSIEKLNETVLRLWNACRRLPKSGFVVKLADGAVTLSKDRLGHLVLLFEGMALTIEHKKGSIGYIEDPALTKGLPLKDAVRVQQQLLERLTNVIEFETLPPGVKSQSPFRRPRLIHHRRAD